MSVEITAGIRIVHAVNTLVTLFLVVAAVMLYVQADILRKKNLSLNPGNPGGWAVPRSRRQLDFLFWVGLHFL